MAGTVDAARNGGKKRWLETSVAQSILSPNKKARERKPRAFYLAGKAGLFAQFFLDSVDHCIG